MIRRRHAVNGSRLIAAIALAATLCACNQGSSGAGSTSGGATTGSSSIADSVAFAQPRYSTSQGQGSVALTVMRSGAASDAISVAYTTTSGTAVGGTNFTVTSGTLQWAANDAASRTISIPISATAPISGTMSFSVALASPTGGAVLGSPSSATVTITATAAGSLSLSASNYTVSQGAGTFTVTVERSGGSSGSISATYATSDGTAVAGTDYTATSGTLQWQNGDSSSKTVLSSGPP